MMKSYTMILLYILPLIYLEQHFKNLSKIDKTFVPNAKTSSKNTKNLYKTDKIVEILLLSLYHINSLKLKKEVKISHQKILDILNCTTECRNQGFIASHTLCVPTVTDRKNDKSTSTKFQTKQKQKQKIKTTYLLQKYRKFENQGIEKKKYYQKHKKLVLAITRF